MHFIDFLFPPNPEELQLRALSPEEFIKIAKSAGKTEFPFISSLFSYKDPLVKELIWQIKYKKNHHALECAAFALLKKIHEPTLLIPIPITKKRRKDRGYNQCEMIIDEILRQDRTGKFTKNFNLLIRNKDIEKQAFKNREERLSDIKDVFMIKDVVDKNQRIIIVDDVSTTGSTLKEARDGLLKAGYMNVECLTIAH